jgi:hypothetical protein
MALNANALVDLDDVKNYIKSFDDTDADQVATIENLINSASEWFDGYVGYSVKAADVTFKNFVMIGGTDIALPSYPVNSIASFKVDSSTYVKDTDFYLDGRSGLCKFAIEFTPGRHLLEATFNAGFATIPDDIKGAVLELIVWNNMRINTSGFGVRQQTVGESTTTFEINVPFSARAVADRYKRKVF